MKTLNLSVNEFKAKYPRQYKLIHKTYSSIFDKLAALTLYYNNIPQPTCEICGTVLSITKKYRNTNQKNRCADHINTTVIDKTLLENDKKIISELPRYPTRSSIITINCPIHGTYSQKIGDYLDGMSCQKCYHDNRTARISAAEWQERCNLVHNNRYNYSDANYISTSKDVTIKCKDHGPYIQNAGVHMRGHGCKICASNLVSHHNTYSTEQFISKSIDVHHNLYDYSKTIYRGSREYVSITCKKHGEFEQIAYFHLAGNGCPDCGISKTTVKSKAEYEIIEFIKSLGITDVIHSDRSLGFEIDVLVPKHNLAIEYNGVYWHSSNTISRDTIHKLQHITKTEKCSKQGIQLLHILDLEWNDPQKQKIWKSIISYKLGKVEHRIFARNCKLKPVQSDHSKTFLENNHMQGAANGPVRLGLYYQEELVALGVFSKPRFSAQPNTMELLRFATKTNTSVIGAFSRIMSNFKKQYSVNIISYANRRWSDGNVYKTNNMKELDSAGPGYYYTDCRQIWHRSSFQKHKLSSKLKQFNPLLSEVENMYNNNYRRIWDAGHLIFVENI